MSSGTITRFSVGHPMPIGRLYNARTGVDYGVSLFDQIPDELIIRDRQSYLKLESSIYDGLSSALKSFNVAASVKLSAGFGPLKAEISGVASALLDERTSSRAAHVSLTYLKHAKYEHVNLFDQRFKQLINEQALNYSGGTHVVIGRVMGNAAVVTGELSTSDMSKLARAKVSLKGNFDKIIKALGDVKAKADLSSEVSASASKTSLVFKVNGDFSESPAIPSSFEEVKDLISNIQNYMKVEKPVEYKLFPLNILKQEVFKDLVTAQFSLPLADESQCEEALELLDEITTSRLKIEDVLNDINNGQVELTDEIVDEVREALDVVKEFQRNFLRDIKEVLFSAANTGDDGTISSACLGNINVEYREKFKAIEKQDRNVMIKVITVNNKVVLVRDLMRRELREEAVRIAVDALVKHKQDIDAVAEQLRNTFDQNYGEYWQCFISRYTLHNRTWYETHFLEFEVGQVTIVLFRACASLRDFDDRKVTVDTIKGMTSAMKDLAIDTTLKAIDNGDKLSDIISCIKKTFEDKYEKYWTCFAGPKLNWHCTHEGYYLNFWVGNVEFVLFKGTC